MEPRKILTSNQDKLYKQILNLIKKYRATHRTFLRSPLRYCIDQIRFLAFNRKNNSHESSIVITEALTEIVILQSITFEDFAAVLEALELDFRYTLEEAGVSVLFTLFYGLIGHISDQMCNTGEAVHSLQSITDILRSCPQFSHTFDPRNIACYDQFLSRIRALQNFDIETLAEEARIVLSTDAPLSLQTVLLRGLAHAILRQADPESHVDHGEQIDIEASTAIRLVSTAILYQTRERRVAEARAAYAVAHPNRHTAFTTAIRWNERLAFISPAYACAVLSTFFARAFSELVVNRARDDLRTRFNITFSLNHTREYSSTVNTVLNNTTNNATVFVPTHSSEYFPEWNGLANGIPSYFTTFLSCIQLAFALPPTVLGIHRRVFIRRYLENHNPTREEILNDLTFQSILLFRWFGNLALQPADCISHAVKDAIFKWSIFRYFTPSSAIEEPCKFEYVHNVRQRFSSRNARRFHTDTMFSLGTAGTILALEYTDVALFNFKNIGFTFFVKFARTLGAIRPIFMNRIHGNMLYNPRLESLVITNLVRITGTVPLLPLYDTFGAQLRYMNLLTAIDVIVTSNVDARSSRLFNECTILEEHLTAIENVTQNVLEYRGALALLAPELHRRFDDARYIIPISILLEEDYKEAQKKRASRKPRYSISQDTTTLSTEQLEQEIASANEEGVSLLGMRPLESSQQTPTTESTEQELSSSYKYTFLHQSRQDFSSEPERRKARKPLHKKQPKSIYTGEGSQQDKTKQQKKKKLSPDTQNVQLLSHIAQTDDIQVEDETFTIPDMPQQPQPQPSPRLLSFLEFAQADLQALEQHIQLSTDAQRICTTQQQSALTTQHLTTNVMHHAARESYIQSTQDQQQPNDNQLSSTQTHVPASGIPGVTLISSTRRSSTVSVHSLSPIFVQQSTGSNEGENTPSEDDTNPSSQVALASISGVSQGQFHQQQQ